MKISPRRIDKSSMRRVVITIIAILFNVIPAYFVYRFKLPIYIDTIGTIFVSAVAGTFPGIITAVATNLICSMFNHTALYYMLLNIFIAFFISWYVRKEKYKKKRNLIPHMLVLAFIGGGLGTVFQWLLLKGPQFEDVAQTAKIVAKGSETGYFFTAMLLNVVLNLLDKSITTGIGVALIYIMPAHMREEIYNSGWKQRPLSDKERKDITAKTDKKRHSVQTRTTAMLTVASLSIAFIMGFISVSLHFEDTKKNYTQNAINAAKFVASVVDPDMVNRYIEEGQSAPGYLETKKLIKEIHDNSLGIEYLYVVKIVEDGCVFVFDVETEDVPAYEPGEKIEFEEAFLPYIPTLLKGDGIEPIESNDVSGWVMTAYYPIRNSSRETVCYAAADVSMLYLSDYIKEFVLRTLLVFAGFFILIMGYGLWITGHFLIYPIGSMANKAENFIKGMDDQESLEESVKELRKLDIHTGDEVEKLYRAICEMGAETAEQMREIRYYAEATARMQNGLIITMADMVENRDSDTGAHIQKTAAYVKIIVEGLKAKGYYLEKLTPRFMSAVVMSAPLHDVGKIHVPDAILNKPGKLDPDEFEIMKTHTTAGKKIMEQAISTVNGENYLKEARNMAAYHHERWDGKGYPDGLHGQVIPLSARIMAVADVFDALTSPRIYKPAFPLEKALEILKEGAGTQFDPKCVEVFMDSLTEVKVVLKKYQES